MKVGIMQPYFFPYPGHFSLIAYTNRWIVFDESQYTPKTWINRNRVLHPISGWNWIVVPLANASIHISIREAKILSIKNACRSTLGKLTHYKSRAPFYKDVIELVNDTFALPAQEDSLVQLNIRSLKNVCKYLKIPFNYSICSDLDITFPPDLRPGEWALEICKSQGFTHYVNPLGGRTLFTPEKYTQAGVKLSFLQTSTLTYTPSGHSFVQDLSILDMLMWQPPEDVREGILSNAALTD